MPQVIDLPISFFAPDGGYERLLAQIEAYRAYS